MPESSRVARVESTVPLVTVSFPDDPTAIVIPATRRPEGLVLVVADRVMTRRVGRLMFVDYKLGV